MKGNDCGIFYQSQNCDECDFPSIRVRANQSLKLNHTIIESAQIKRGCEARLEFYNDSGNSDSISISTSDRISVSSNFQVNPTHAIQ
jgi:hypothetical protein